MRIRSRFILASCLASAVCVASASFDVASQLGFSLVARVACGQDDDPFGGDDEEEDPFGADESDAEDQEEIEVTLDGGENDAEDSEEIEVTLGGDDDDDPFGDGDGRATTPFASSPSRSGDSAESAFPTAFATEEEARAAERAKYARAADAPDELKTEADFYETLSIPERSILSDPPQTDADFFAAAAKVARFGRLEFAKLLAARALKAPQATPQECAAKYEEIGPAIAAQLGSIGGDCAAAYELARSRAQEWYENEEELRKAFDAIGSSALPDERDAALARAQRGGAVAVRLLVKDLLGADVAARDRAIDLLPLFESDARAALLAGVRDASDSEVAVLAPALKNFADPEVAFELDARACLMPSGASRDKVKETVATLLGFESEPASTAAQATDLARGLFARDLNLPGVVDGELDVWEWVPADSAPTKRAVSVESRYLSEASRWALAGYKIGTSADAIPEGALDLAIAAVSEREARAVGLDSARLGVDAVKEKLPNLTAADLVSSVRFALGKKRDVAALIPMIMLQDLGDASLCVAPEGGTSVVVQAATQGNRRLRFEALAAIAKWNPERSYVGSSRALQALSWFATGTGDRVAVVCFPQLAEGSAIASAFVAQGYKIIQTSTGRDAILAAQSCADVEFVFVASTTSSPNPRVVAQALRADPRTSDVPLLVGFMDDREATRARVDVGLEPNAFAAPSPGDLESSAWALQQLFERANVEQVASDVRLTQSKNAARALLKLVATRPNVYDFDSANETIARMLSTPALFDEGLEFAATVKTTYAQNALVDLVGDPRFDISTRRRALQAFERQMRNSGSLLRGPDVRRMYDRYNASEFENEETQQVLSDLLDAYERAVSNRR